MNENEQYQQARKRVKEKKKFYNHLSIYLVMSGFFFLVNYFSSPGRWWFYWPMLGWGIGVAMQYFKVFGLTGAGIGTKEWEEREIKKEMKKMGTPQPSARLKSSSKSTLDLDDHLQLKEIKKEKVKATGYRDEDLV